MATECCAASKIARHGKLLFACPAQQQNRRAGEASPVEAPTRANPPLEHDVRPRRNLVELGNQAHVCSHAADNDPERGLPGHDADRGSQLEPGELVRARFTRPGTIPGREGAGDLRSIEDFHVPSQSSSRQGTLQQNRKLPSNGPRQTGPSSQASHSTSHCKQ